MNDLPKSWTQVPVTEVLKPNNNGKPFQQGWSPQCYSTPAPQGSWGVLKTTAIQHGQYWPHENKTLPDNLEPRPQIEVKPGDVLMTCAGPRSRCGVTCLVERTPKRLMMSGKIYRFRPNPNAMHAKYLMYFLLTRASQLQIDRMKTGISDSGLNLTHDRFATLKVPLPPIAEQQRIVAKIEKLFSELNKGVESLITAREKMAAYRKAVLKAAFAGQLTASDSDDWEAYRVGQLVTDVRYGTAKKCAVDPKKTPVLRIPNIASGRIDLEDLKHTELTVDELAKLRLEPGDILLVRSNGSVSLVGLSAVVTASAAGYAYAGYLIRLRVKKEVILPEFLSLYLHSPAVRMGVERQARSTSGVHNINSDELKAIAIRVPPIPTQHAVIDTVNKISSRIDDLEFCTDAELKRCAALQQAILGEAFSGQLVAQNPEDEPASALLERIHAERDGATRKKERTAKNGKKKAA